MPDFFTYPVKGLENQPYSEELHAAIFDVCDKHFIQRTGGSSCDFANIPRSSPSNDYNEVCSIGEVAVHNGRPCHYRMKYTGWCLLSVRNCIPTLQDKQHLYWSWLAKESPWAGIFLSKNSDIFLEKGLMLITDKSETSRGMALGAAIASRSLTEHVKHARMWFDLVERGCDPTYAYAVSMAFKVDDETHPKKSFISPVGHGGLSPAAWEGKDFMRWMLREPTKSESAHGSFCVDSNEYDCAGDDSFLFCCGTPEYEKSGGGRFVSDSTRYYPYGKLVNFYVDNEVAILKHHCPSYEKQPLGSVVVPVVERKPIKNPNEPEGDL